MPQQMTLQFINYSQRGLWLLFISLVFIVGTLGSQGTSVSPSNPLLLLREELVGAIEDLHTNGDPGLEEAMAELISQLEQLQSTPGEPLELEWEHAGLNSTTSRSVCFVVSSFEGLYLNSGIGTAYYALAELLARGNKVTVLYTRDSPPTTGSFNDWVQHYAAQGIDLRSLPPSDKRITNPKLQVTSAQVYQYLKLNHFDIVHFADFEGLGFYSTLAKRVGFALQDTLLVAGLHGPTRWVLNANEMRIPSHESELEVDFMERVSVENADVVWTPSTVLASWLSERGWNLSQGVHLLPLPPGPEVRNVHEASQVKAREFVFFGRLEKRKGLMLFCDSVDLLASMGSIKDDLTITFLGTNGFVDGLDSVEYIQGRSARWAFKTNIISNATRESALEYLMDSKAGRIPVIPSIIDNAPYTVYECLYAGIPLLASATPSIIPLFAKPGHHLFDLKPHHLASRMVYAIRNGLAAAKPVFTAEAAENVWVSFYSTLRLPQPVAVVDDQPTVSVCLIHYNRPELVQQALVSINDQDYKKVEVILVDDGSNDTAAIKYLDSIQQSFDAQGWKIIRTANKYLGAARNTAAKEATGKYLLFLDDDNVAYPHQISTYVTAAQKTKAHVLTAGHAVVKGVSTPSTEAVDHYWYPLGPSLAVGLFKNCFGDANFFVEKTAFFNIGGFTEEHSVGLEEHEFFAKAVLSGYQLEVVPEPLLFYRMHDESNQMLFTLDQRLGEARRIRPYIDALAPTSQTETRAAEQQQNMKTRRSLVNLVARNAVDTYQDCNQTLSSVSPSNGPVIGGTTISLKGVGFSCGVQAVKVDGQECTGIKVVSNYEITCQTPAGSRTYTPVDITADVGGSTISLHSAFTYVSGAAPAMNSCRLADDGVSISCSFSSPTDQSSGSCSSLFDSDSVFGSGANCFWTSDVILTIDLGKGATIKIGDDIHIKAGVVKSKGDSKVANDASSTPLLAPLSPPTPVATISTPSSVGSCDGITLDASSATGDLGRSLTYEWSLESVKPSDSDSEKSVKSALSDATSQNLNKVTIKADDVVVAAYTFTLTVTNWIGGKASSTITVSKTTDAVPIVSISGPSVVQMFKNAELSLTGSVSSSCGNQIGTPTYAWTITPSVSVDASALTSVNLEVPENTFSAGTSYTVKFTATDNGISNSATVTVTIGVRPLVVSISGGNKQYQDSDTVALDGSASSDPEGETITYAWSCVSFYDSSKPCSINTPTDAKFSFSASSLGAGKYTITLTVSGTASRTASDNVWVEIGEVTVLSISIKAVTNPVDPTQRLSLSGVLDQQGVELSDVTWSWTLTSGSLANPSSAYLSDTTAQDLIIAADALTPGSSYTYKLSATQTSTGMSGTATITFSVKKGITTGDLGCQVTSGTAESTDFIYNFGAMWGSTSGIQSYEIRFVPQGSSIEIPLAEPSSNTSITTKLPYGKLTIVGIAVSGNGVSARKECHADVTYSDVKSGLSQLATLAGASGLSAFEIARYAAGAKVAFDKAGSSGSSDMASIRSSLLSAVQGSISGLTVAADAAHTSTFLVLTDTDIGILSKSALVSTISAFGSLLDAQAGISNVNSSVLAADVAILSNLVDQLSNQQFDVKVLVKRDTQGDQDLWSAFQSLIDTSAKVAEQYLSSVADGQSQITISQSLLTMSLYAASTSKMSSQGVTMGKSSTVKLPPNFMASSSASAASSMALALSSWGVSPYPSSASVVSPVLILTAAASGSVIDLGELPSPATVFVPKSELLDDSNLACATWSNSNSSWNTDGCTTTTSSKGVSCQCDRASSAFAVVKSVDSKASISGKDDGGLAGKWIGVIAGVGGVALIALIVGAVIGVKRHRANAAPATPAVAATPSVPVAAEGASSSSSSAIPVALSGIAVDANGTPRSVSGSSYSSASSRSIVSSSSSEEEAMEQQIKDIVGELSSALPRDPRALEVLGDRLDME